MRRLGGLQQRGGDLEEERREGVEVALVDQHRLDRGIAQRAGAGQAAEAGPHDHHPGRPAEEESVTEGGGSISRVSR